MPREVSGDDLWIPLVSGSQVVHLLSPHLPVANGLLSSSHFRKLRRAIRDSGGISHFCSTYSETGSRLPAEIRYANHLRHALILHYWFGWEARE